MTTTETVIAVIVALGGGTIAREIITGLARWITGRQDRERSALRQAYADLDAARDRADEERDRADSESARADHEAARRRIITEHAHDLRVLLTRHGVPADTIPPFPPTPIKETSS